MRHPLQIAALLLLGRLCGAQPVDVRDHGAIGDGVTDNRVAFAGAISTAVGTGRPLYVPTGTWLVTLTPADPALVVSGSLRVLGDGHGSVVRFGPERPSFAFSGFRITGGTSFSFENLTLRGPDDPCAGSLTGSGCLPIGTSSETYVSTVGVSYESLTGGAVLSMDHVSVSGQFTYPLQVGAGYGSLDTIISRADLRGYAGSVAYFCDDGIAKSLHVLDSKLHDNVLASGHLLYVHPSVSLLVDRTQFLNAQFYSLHNYGTSTTTAGRYTIITNSSFEGLGRGIYTNRRSASRIDACVFRVAQGINVSQAGALVTGSQFYADTFGALSTGITYTGGTGDVVVSDSTFDSSTVEVGGGFRWLVNSSTFVNGAQVTVNNATVTTIDHCTFDVALPAVSAIGTGATNLGQLLVRSGVFRGQASSGFIAGRIAESLTVEACRFFDSPWAVRVYDNSGYKLDMSVVSGQVVDANFVARP